jgi:hypothetical protein
MLSMQRHIAASEELASIFDDLQADDRRAARERDAAASLKILAATRTLGERDF